MLDIAHSASKVPFVKQLLKPIYYPIKGLFAKRRNTIFKKKALGVLDDFNHCMIKNDFKYTLAFGTMLGAVREKGFIKHDMDIDTAIWDSDYSPAIKQALETSGFKLDHEFLIDGGESGREQTYSKDGVSIDIFYFYPPMESGRNPYCCDFLSYGDAATHKASMVKYGKVLPRRVELPMGHEYILTPFENLLLPIPSNARQILEFRYGPDFMTPNPEWGIQSYDNHIVEWREKAAVYSES